MTAVLNLAWFTRYEPRKPHSDDVIAVFPLSACYALSSALPPRMVLEEPNFCEIFISDNKISYTCRMEYQQHTEKSIMWFCSLVAKLGCSKKRSGSSAYLSHCERPSEREKAVTSSPSSFRGSYLVNQAKFTSAVIATTIFTAKASHIYKI